MPQTAEPLVDSTNQEGEDLATPLPQSWDLATLKTLKVVLYGQKISPPCCKLRFLLKYYQVPFEEVGGKKPESNYTKIPVLDVGDRQINDSYIIVKNLAPILQGRKLTDREVEIEKKLTFAIMIALERDCASSVRDLCGCASLLGGGMGCALGTMAPIIACCIGPKIGKDKELTSLEEYSGFLSSELANNLFFGGSEPSVTDVSIFGVLLPFEAAGNSCLGDLLGAASLKQWYERMHQKAAGINIF